MKSMFSISLYPNDLTINGYVNYPKHMVRTEFSLFISCATSINRLGTNPERMTRGHQAVSLWHRYTICSETAFASRQGVINVYMTYKCANCCTFGGRETTRMRTCELQVNIFSIYCLLAGMVTCISVLQHCTTYIASFTNRKFNQVLKYSGKVDRFAL